MPRKEEHRRRKQRRYYGTRKNIEKEKKKGKMSTGQKEGKPKRKITEVRKRLLSAEINEKQKVEEKRKR